MVTGLLLMAGTLLIDWATKDAAAKMERPLLLGLGTVEIFPVSSSIWFNRSRRMRSTSRWGMWLVPAWTLIAVGCLVPAMLPWVGLLLGGSLSHALESSRSERVVDFIKIMPFPRFNIADLAIVAGSVGLIYAGCLHLVSLS